MNSRLNTQAALGRHSHLPAAIYRVVALHRDHSESLVTLAENPRQAAVLAKAFCETLNAGSNGNGIVSVRTDEWIGTLVEGKWQPISRNQGGFSHRIATPNIPGKRGPIFRSPGGFARKVTKSSSRTEDHRNPSLPGTGDKVECVLLNEKTRKGGWRAKLLKHPAAGPITNTHQVPHSARRGQIVWLRVGVINQDGTRIQFHWGQNDNPECR